MFPDPKPKSAPRCAIVEDATKALVTLGWKPTVVAAAIRAATDTIGTEVPLEMFIREALRHCR